MSENVLKLASLYGDCYQWEDMHWVFGPEYRRRAILHAIIYYKDKDLICTSKPGLFQDSLVL
jgi:hypothetical protein